MADNTVQTGSDVIATDDLTSINGTTIPAGTEKVQRMKVGYGDPKSHRDVSPTFPLPVMTTVQAQYYASSTGLNSMYGSTSDVFTSGLAPTDVPYFSVHNPTGNPLYIYKISIGAGAGAAGLFRRKRFTGVPTGGTARPIDNRAGVANTPHGVTLVASATTGLVLPGTPVTQKALNIASNGQDTSNEDFSLIIPVGQGIAFTYTGASNGIITTEVVWSEGISLT